MSHSVADLLTAAARNHPDDVAVVEAASGRRTTWAELDDQVSRVAAGLGEVGSVAGYRVMLVMGNRLEFVTTYFGALRAQQVAVPVNPGSTPPEIAGVALDCGARVVVVDEGSVAQVREALDLAAAQQPDAAAPLVITVGTTVRPGERSYDELLGHGDDGWTELRDPETLAALLYTSGASGRPRAAMLTHRALLANADQIAAVEPPMLAADDVILGVLPLFHVYGLNAVLGGCVRMQARLVLADTFDPNGTLDLIEDEAVSIVPVAPPVFAHWLRMDDLAERLGPVRLVLSGSAPLDAEVIGRFEESARVPVHQGYGLTEAAPVVTSTLCSDSAEAGSVGAALPGIEVRLRDVDGRAPEGTDPGDIEIRGDNLFSGYWPDGAEAPDDEGWWRTGDVGFLDPDGDLFLIDRSKDLVIISGFNVYPTEVEEVIRRVDGVSDAAVIGVADERTGEAVVAYVVSVGDPEEVRAAVARQCGEQLARFKQPRVVHVVAELPRTVTGKIQKGRLRAAERRRTTPLLEDVESPT